MRIALEKAQKNYEDINVVIKTGGSSKGFYIQELLTNIFPKAEITQGDAFTDVTAGLAIAAYKNNY